MKIHKINILHLNSFTTGGAFTGAYRLHKSLLDHGLSSKMLVKEDKKRQIYENVASLDLTEKQPNLINRLFTKFGWPVTSAQKRYNYLKGLKGEYEIISFPFSDFDITQTNEYKACDIVHLHWVAGLIDYKSFFKNCTKPVVLTLRDLYPIQGIFHYKNDFIKNEEVFGVLDQKMRKVKIDAIRNFKYPLTVVGISDYVTQMSRESAVHQGLPHQTIHNCIDIKNYALIDKNILRKEFSIPANHLVFSFVSDRVANQQKGIDLLLGAITSIKCESPITILTIGGGIAPVFPFNITHRHLGRCSQKDLNRIYGVSDAFIFPTKEEALGNVMLEAMACGVPVIGTPVGGLLDVIKPGFNGVFSDDVSVEGLKDAIERFIEIKDSFNSIEIRNYIKENFSEDLVVEKYITLYKSLIESSKNQ